MLRQHIALGGLTAVFHRPPFTEDGYPVYSRAFLCPICLSLWAKITIEGQRAYTVEQVSCEDCFYLTDLSPVPGSLLDYHLSSLRLDLGTLGGMPEELVRREFYLTTKAAETWQVQKADNQISTSTPSINLTKSDLVSEPLGLTTTALSG